MKSRVLFIILVLFLMIFSISFLFVKQNDSSKTNSINEKTEARKSQAEALVVVQQEPIDKVTVESATLTKDGFVVVRKMDEGKLSQVIEMSRPLKAGTHKDVTISLGSADVSNEELIVMIYEDYAKDGIFNDLDMPAVNDEGFMTARYVKTGKSLPSSIAEGEAAISHSMAGMKSMAKVRYTDNGFVPDKVTVNAGDMVEFINESSDVMWVASAPHPSHEKLPTFDQFRSYKKGGIYRYIFEKKGTWEFHDHINPSRGGVVRAL